MCISTNSTNCDSLDDTNNNIEVNEDEPSTVGDNNESLTNNNDPVPSNNDSVPNQRKKSAGKYGIPKLRQNC